MKEIEGVVVLGFGPQPMDFFSKFQEIFGKGANIDSDVARMAGAHFAVGPREALQVLRSRLEAGSLEYQKKANPNLSAEAIEWLAKGSRGISSNTIFTVLTGVDALRGSSPSHPHDPSDLDRCLRLLDAVPELQPEMQRMARVSKHWAALMARWNEIVACHLDEVGLGWTKAQSAPKTYALMRSILDSVNAKEQP